MSEVELKTLKRRQAIEPVIGHLKSDHRMGRCHLKGSLGDKLHAVLCAAGYNCVFRPIVTGRSGIVTADSGIVTDRSGIVTEGVRKGFEGCV